MSTELPGRRTKGQCWKDVIRVGDRWELTTWEPHWLYTEPRIPALKHVCIPGGKASIALVMYLQTPGAARQGPVFGQRLRASRNQTLFIWRL